jgi:plasmid rolling circle replication initiator protein Rep
MNANLNNQQQNNTVRASLSANNNSFDFELWANQVRRQMIAVLQRRYSEKEVKSNGKEAKVRHKVD